MDQAVEPLWLRISLIVAFGFITGRVYHRHGQIASSFGTGWAGGPLHPGPELLTCRSMQRTVRYSSAFMRHRHTEVDCTSPVNFVAERRRL